MATHLLATVIATLSVLLAHAPAPPQPASAPPVAAVKSWLAALATRDAKQLRAASVLPFTYATDDEHKKCDSRAKDEKTLATTLGCILTSENLLIAELTDPDGVMLQGAAQNGAPPSSPQAAANQKLIERLGTGDGQLTLGGFLNGDGDTFEFIFAVRPDKTGKKLKVAGLLLHRESVE